MSHDQHNDIVETAEDIAYDAHNASILDGNLARIRKEDPDADTAFTVGFLAALINPGLNNELADAIAQYARAKHAQGRPDMYDALFAGTL